MNIDLADMGVFLSDFATTVSATSWGATFPGIFDYEYVEFGTVAGERPVLLVEASNIKTGYASGDRFTVNGSDYQLVDVQYSEPGLKRIVLADV